MIKSYYRLAKPGIVYGNAVTAAAGFFLASKGHLSISLFFEMLLGLSLVIGSGCVFNNYLDREIDAKMGRTKMRALATREIPVGAALIYGLGLLICGSLVLGLFTNFLALLIALSGWIFYVGVYGYFKRRTSWSTVIGSVPGAVPPVVGYCAVTGHFDKAALLLFLIVACWQLPHFYSIAIFRLKDYKAAGLPVLPAVKGLAFTKKQIVIFVLAFGAAAFLLGLQGYDSWVYAGFIALMDGYWLFVGLKGFRATNSTRWAKQMFGISLIVITLWSVAVSIGSLFR